MFPKASDALVSATAASVDVTAELIYVAAANAQTDATALHLLQENDASNSELSTNLGVTIESLAIQSVSEKIISARPPPPSPPFAASPSLPLVSPSTSPTQSPSLPQVLMPAPAPPKEPASDLSNTQLGQGTADGQSSAAGSAPSGITAEASAIFITVGVVLGVIACLLFIFFYIRSKHNLSRFALRKSRSALEASSSDVIIESYDEVDDLPKQGHPSRLGRARKAADDKRPETIKRKMTESLVDVTPQGATRVKSGQCGGSAEQDEASGDVITGKRLFDEEEL